MIKTCGYIFRNFVNSIKNIPEKEKYIQRFTKLMSIKYELIYEILKPKIGYYWSGERFDSIFNKNNLDTFTDETYTNATEKQLDFINSCASESYKTETCERLNHLVQTKGFSNYLLNFDLMMRLYTDEQLETLNFYISHEIDRFSQTEESLNKIVDFVQRRPDLITRIGEISEEDFMEIDNFTLFKVFDSYHFINYDDDLNLMVKSIKLKVVLKKLLGFYKKNVTQEQKGPVLIKK